MFDLEQWIDEHDLTVVRTAPFGKGGRKWILNPCPWDEDHRDNSAHIVQVSEAGGIQAGCLHDGCADKDWHALRKLLEPDWREHGKAEEDEDETAFYAGDRHSYDEMLKSEPPPVEWLAEGFVPARPIVAVASGPGEGKTWFGLCLGLSIAAGKPLFGNYATKQTSVLYLDAENPYADMHRRVTALMVGLGLPTNSLPFVYRGDVRINLRSPDDVARLVELINEERPGVVFIDSLIDFHSADENSAKDMNKVMLALRRIAQDCGVSFVLLHHFRKSSKQAPNDSVTRFKGSVNIAGSIDVVFGLRATTDGSIVIDVAKERVRTLAKPIKIALRDTDDGGVTMEFIGDCTTTDEEARTFIRDWLADGEEHSRQDILNDAKGRGLSSRAVDDQLKAMAKEEELKDGKDGHQKTYRLKENNVVPL